MAIVMTAEELSKISAANDLGETEGATAATGQAVPATGSGYDPRPSRRRDLLDPLQSSAVADHGRVLAAPAPCYHSGRAGMAATRKPNTLTIIPEEDHSA